MATKEHIPEALRRRVRERAAGRCEYCLLHDEDSLLPHEADHVIAEKHGGQATLGNLAWACAVCNRYKGSDLSSVDPRSGRITLLYNPRSQRWKRHFRLTDARLEPLTASGRATARLLRINARERMLERAILIAAGRYPRR